MGTTRLQLYNRALQLCGEPRLANLSENVKRRHELDQIWSGSDGIGGWINAVLEQGQWAWASRTSQIDSDPDVEMQFGFANAFTRPDDWIATMGVSADPTLMPSLRRYRDEGDYWYADVDPIYVRYVSNDVAYGGNLDRWPETFVEYAAAYGAGKVVMTLNSDAKRWDLLHHPKTGYVSQALKAAKSMSSMRQPSIPMPENSWNRSRRGTRGNGRNDGGNPNEFTG